MLPEEFSDKGSYYHISIIASGLNSILIHNILGLFFTVSHIAKHLLRPKDSLEKIIEVYS